MPSRLAAMRKGFYIKVSLLALLGAAATRAQSPFFPPGSLHDSARAWYSKQLKGLGEPSLWAFSKTQQGQSYRFLWLRTFDQPIAVRIEVNPDGTSRLTVKIAGGAGGYDPGHLIRNDQKLLSKERTDWFLKKIQAHEFWKLPTVEKSPGGPDGAHWIMEGAKDANYHLVDRWSPNDGPIRALGLLMLRDLAKVNVPSKEVY